MPRFSGDERIEARLLEYLEGELPANEAAEIQAHLLRNPQQQQLLTELAATRAAVAGLPQGPAPLEVYDAVQARLERSALLDEPAAQHTAKATKPRLLPQVLAVGGITAAAAALAWVVFVVVAPQRVPEPVVVASVGPAVEENVLKRAKAATLPGSVVADIVGEIAASPTTRPSVQMANVRTGYAVAGAGPAYDRLQNQADKNQMNSGVVVADYRPRVPVGAGILAGGIGMAATLPASPATPTPMAAPHVPAGPTTSPATRP